MITIHCTLSSREHAVLLSDFSSLPLIFCLCLREFRTGLVPVALRYVFVAGGTSPGFSRGVRKPVTEVQCPNMLVLAPEPL